MSNAPPPLWPWMVGLAVIVLAILFVVLALSSMSWS